MAVIKFGSIITDGRGSLGGSTIQSDRSGHIWRNKPLPLKSRSPAQSLIRSYNKTMQAGWRSLSEPNKRIWNDYPKINHIFNRSGEKHPLSGHSLWMKYQYAYLSNHIPFLSNPANYLTEPLGPELISNNNFSSPADWSLNPESSINGGFLFAHAPLIGNGYSFIACPGINVPKSYRVTYSSFNLVPLCRYGNGWSPSPSFKSGIYYAVYTPLGNSNSFYVYTANNSSITLDYLSLKEIL